MTEEAEPRTGIVNGISSRLILIGDSKCFLGEYKTDGVVDIGDTVEFGIDAHEWLTSLVVIKKANGSTPAAPPKKGGPAPKVEDPAPKCIKGECPDKASHFAFNKQRNRWECNLMGIDNPNITNCPQVPKKPEPSKDLEKKLAANGFDAPAEGKPAPVPLHVVGIYVNHDPKAHTLMLKINGANAAYSADRSVIQYLESKDSKVVKGESTVTIEIEDVPKKGMVAMRIGPGPEPAPVQQKPPVQNPAPKAATPAGQQVQQPPVAPAGAIVVQEHEYDKVVPLSPGSSAPMVFDDDQINLIKSTVATNCTTTEFKLLMYLAAQYHLDPIRRQIWAVKYGDNPAAIFTGRDGFLAIAHRDGHLDGMESGVKSSDDGKDMIGWCKVYRKDMSHPFYVEVYLSDYEQPIGRSGKPGMWQKMPRVMIQKVAESSCLRRAFSISGLYSPEEINTSGGA